METYINLFHGRLNICIVSSAPCITPETHTVTITIFLIFVVHAQNLTPRINHMFVITFRVAVNQFVDNYLREHVLHEGLVGDLYQKPQKLREETG